MAEEYVGKEQFGEFVKRVEQGFAQALVEEAISAAGAENS